MKKAELDPFLNKIVCLDLVNRERPVAKLVALDETHATLKDPYIYVPVPVGNGMQVQALSYAAPLFNVKEIKVELQHIMLRFDLESQMEQAYIRQTTSLVTPNKPSIIVP